MSANLELVRSIWAPWERGDFSSAQWADPEIEFVLVGVPGEGTWIGPAGMAEGWRGFLSAWSDLRANAGEIVELEGDRVAVLAQFSARGKTSGLQVGQMRWKAANVFHFRDGKVAKLVIRFDQDRAIAELGLEAPGSEPGVSSNLELVRSIYARWEGGDYKSVDWTHPEIEWVIADGPHPGSWTGSTGASASWAEFMRAWDELHFEAEEFVSIDEQRVLVLARFHGRGKSSGLELGRIGSSVAHLFHVRGGKVTRHVLYFDRRRALAELGL